MKVKVEDILKNFEKLKQETNLFKSGTGKFLINNQNAFSIQPAIRTGNFWRAEISEQGDLETTGAEIIWLLAENPYVVPINTPNKFILNWTTTAFESISRPNCITLIDDFQHCNFLKPKINHVMNNKIMFFDSLKRLPRKIILEMAKALIDFDKYYKSRTKDESYMSACEIIFQHGFVLDSDPQKIILREFWNSSNDVAGVARVVKTINESEFTGRRERFSF